MSSSRPLLGKAGCREHLKVRHGIKELKERGAGGESCCSRFCSARGFYPCRLAVDTDAPSHSHTVFPSRCFALHRPRLLSFGFYSTDMHPFLFPPAGVLQPPFQDNAGSVISFFPLSLDSTAVHTCRRSTSPDVGAVHSPPLLRSASARRTPRRSHRHRLCPRVLSTGADAAALARKWTDLR